MADSAFTAVTNLLRASATIGERLAHSISCVHGLSLNELLLLMFLAGAPARKMSRVELARCMNLSASTITRQLAPLEKRGIVARESGTRDARLSYVVLTPAGDELTAAARNTLQQAAELCFKDRWNASEVAALADLLGRLTAHLPGSLS